MRRILLVDDSLAVRRSIEACLQPWGFEIGHAENGAKALVQLKTMPFDLVFLDINMPVLDGPSLLRLLRAQGITARVVLITSGVSKAVISETVRLGATNYISKPFTPEQIRDVVGKSLGLDLARLPQYRPGVLLLDPQQATAEALRKLLPEHVTLDATALLSDALDLAETQRYALILLHETLAEAAPLVRAAQPDAVLLKLAEGVAAPAFASVEAVQEGFDGIIPAVPGAPAVQGFLYPSFLRPLVFPEPGALRAAGYEGAPEHELAYFAQLRRALAAHARQEVSVMPDVRLDLRHVLPRPEPVAALVQALGAELAELGAAPAFILSADLRAKLEGRPDLDRAVFIDALA